MAATTIGTSGVTFPDATTQTTAPVITKKYESTNQSIATTTSQAFQLAHSLGTVPKIIVLTAVCLTSNNGWTAGQQTEVMVGCIDNGAIQAMPWADSTNVYWTSGSGMIVFNQTNYYSLNIINNSNWAIKVYAYA